jgi:L-rhamnose isomerase/sugar isomerase
LLKAAQRAGDVLQANGIVMDAFQTDVRPLCAKVREELGAAADPIGAFRASGYLEHVTEARSAGVQAGWS